MEVRIDKIHLAAVIGHRWGSRVELEDGSIAEVGQKHNGREVEQISIQTVDGTDDNAVVMYEEGPSSQPTKVK